MALAAAGISTTTISFPVAATTAPRKPTSRCTFNTLTTSMPPTSSTARCPTLSTWKPRLRCSRPISSLSSRGRRHSTWFRANSSQLAIDIPASAFSSGAQFYFVRLTLGKGDGVTVSRNFYWVPSPLTVFDWAKTTYINTPAKTPAVMTELRKLAPATVDAKVDTEGDACWSTLPTTPRGSHFSWRRKRSTTAETSFPCCSGTTTSSNSCRATRRCCPPAYRHPTGDTR